jgi:hypothetical protein
MAKLTAEQSDLLPKRSKPARQRTEEALHEVWKERDAQYRKWGLQYHQPAQWITLMSEELGEAAKEAAHLTWDRPDWPNDFDRVRKMRAELIQLAALAVACWEQLEGGVPV